MHHNLVSAVALLCLPAVAMAQGAPPAQIGNRANGRDYQPTPAQVAPREKAAGVLPSPDKQKAVNGDLERMDKDLLRQEGLDTKSVPKLTQ